MLQNETSQFSVRHGLIWMIFVLIFSVIVVHSAVAAEPERAPNSIDHAVMALTQPSRIFYGGNGDTISPDLIATYNAVRAQEKPLNMCDYVPTDLTATNSSGVVFSRIADKTASTYFSSDAFRSMPIGGAATEVEKSMKADVVIGDSDEVQHKFNFNVQAFQALAKIEYSGITNAAIMYYALQSKVSLEVSEKLGLRKDLVIGQDFSPSDRISQVSFRWKF